MLSGWTRLWIGLSANAIQELSGVNVMSSLGPYIFQTSIGMSRFDALLVAGGLQIFYLLSSLLPWLVVDSAGRRRLFLLGLAGNSSPSAKDIKGVLSAVGIEADDDRLKTLLSELEGKDVAEV